MKSKVLYFFLGLLIILISFGVYQRFKVINSGRSVTGVIVDNSHNPHRGNSKYWRIFYDWKGTFHYAFIDGDEYEIGNVLELKINEDYPDIYVIENRKKMRLRNDALFIGCDYPIDSKNKIEIFDEEKRIKKLLFASEFSFFLEQNKRYKIRYYEKNQIQNEYEFDFNECVNPKFKFITLEYLSTYKKRKIHYNDEGFVIL